MPISPSQPIDKNEREKWEHRLKKAQNSKTLLKNIENDFLDINKRALVLDPWAQDFLNRVSEAMEGHANE